VCDLELEDFSKQLPWVKKTAHQANQVRKFVNNHQAVAAEYGCHCDTHLSQPGETRFASCDGA
jgi:hypothetical protein